MSRISPHTLPARQFQYVETPTQRNERIAFVNRREWARRVSVWAKSIDGEYVDSGVGLLPEPPVSTCSSSGRSRLLTPPPSSSRTRTSPSPSHIPPQLQYTSDDSDSVSSSGSECDCDRNYSCCDCGCCGDVDYDDGFEYPSRKTSTVQVIPVPTSRSPIGSTTTPKIYSRDYYYDSHSPSKSVSFEDSPDPKSLANDYTYSDGGEPYLIYSSSPSSPSTSAPSSSSTSPSSSRSTSPATSTKRSYSSFKPKSNTPPAFPVSILKSSTKPRSNSSPPIYYSSSPAASQPIPPVVKPRSNSSPPAFSASNAAQTFQYTYSNSTNYAIPSSTWSKSHRRHRSSLCSIPEIPDMAEGLEGLEDYI